MTPARLDILIQIDSYRFLRGRSPSYAEMGAVRCTDRVSAFQLCRELLRSGHLRRTEYARGLELTEKGRETIQRPCRLVYLGEVA